MIVVAAFWSAATPWNTSGIACSPSHALQRDPLVVEDSHYLELASQGAHVASERREQVIVTSLQLRQLGLRHLGNLGDLGLRLPGLLTQLTQIHREKLTTYGRTFDDATPNSGTVVFVDGDGATRTLDIISTPFGLDSTEVRDTAVHVELPDDRGASVGRRAGAATQGDTT